MTETGYNIQKLTHGEGFRGTFHAMASECIVLVQCESEKSAVAIINTVCEEAKRIEAKFSRYLKHNIVDQINNSKGKALQLDSETAQLLDFAFTCYQLSEGMFDISSGVLRKAWHFDGSDKLPSAEQISLLLPFIGLDKLSWKAGQLTMPPGMQLDFGGIGKEYAVDCCLKKVSQLPETFPCLLNFGGDLICNGPRKDGTSWKIGIDSVGGGVPAVVTLKQGALATSGDANRYLFKNGQRYSHILNPISGYSVLDAPRSITVAAQSCIEAGLLSTMAMLKGAQATQFLQQQQVKFWVQA